MSKRGATPSTSSAISIHRYKSNEIGELASKKTPSSPNTTQKLFRTVSNEILTRCINRTIEREYFDDLLKTLNTLITHFQAAKNVLEAQLNVSKTAKVGNIKEIERAPSPHVNFKNNENTMKELLDEFCESGIKCSVDLKEISHKGLFSPTKLHALINQNYIRCVGLSTKLHQIKNFMEEANATELSENSISSSTDSGEQDGSGNIDDEASRHHTSQSDPEEIVTTQN